MWASTTHTHMRATHSKRGAGLAGRAAPQELYQQRGVIGTTIDTHRSGSGGARVDVIAALRTGA